MPDYAGQVTITIRAPVESVYAYLADLSRHPEWAKNIGKITPMAGGPATVGSRYKTEEGPPPLPPLPTLKMMFHFVRGVLGGAKPYSVATITALEPPRRIAWEAGIPKAGGYFNAAEWEFVLEPQGDATRVTQSFRWKPQTPVAERMVGAAGSGGLEAAVSASLAELKRRLERSVTEGG